MREPTRGPPAPSPRVVHELGKIIGYENALYALSLSLVRDEPHIKIVVCEGGERRVSLLYRYTPPVLGGDDALRLIGVCVEGLGEVPDEVKSLPAEDILYYRSGNHIWVVVVDEPDPDRALQLVSRFCRGRGSPSRIETGLELNEVC